MGVPARKWAWWVGNVAAVYCGGRRRAVTVVASVSFDSCIFEIRSRILLWYLQQIDWLEIRIRIICRWIRNVVESFCDWLDLELSNPVVLPPRVKTYQRYSKLLPFPWLFSWNLLKQNGYQSRRTRSSLPSESSFRPMCLISIPYNLLPPTASFIYQAVYKRQCESN